MATTMRPALAVLMALVWAAPALAEWQAFAFDNQAWFEAGIRTEPPALSLHCGGRSPGGQPLPQTDEPNLTAPYQMQLRLAAPPLPRSETGDTMRLDDVMVVVGTKGYRLPTLRWDVLYDDGWLQSLEIGDALITAWQSGPDMSVAVQDALIYRTSGQGLAEGLEAALAHCVSRWRALGEAVPPVSAAMVAGLGQAEVPAAPAASAARNAMEEAALAQMQRVCSEGVQEARQGALLQGNLDGDGEPDIVLD